MLRHIKHLWQRPFQSLMSPDTTETESEPITSESISSESIASESIASESIASEAITTDSIATEAGTPDSTAPDFTAPDSTAPDQQQSVAIEQLLETEACERAYQSVLRFYEAGEWDQTVHHSQPLLQRWPTHAPTYKLLGNALYRLGRLSAARQAYGQALDHQPDFAEVHINLGNIDAKEQQWDEAIAHYQDALALDPTFAGAYRNLARAWDHQGNERLAAACRYHAVELDPDSLDAQAYFELGHQLLQHGQPHQAIHCYRRLLPASASGHDELSHDELGRDELSRDELGRKASAHNALENPTENTTDGPGHESALAKYPAAIAKAAPILHQKLADALAATKQWQEAVYHYRQASTLQRAALPAAPNASVPLAPDPGTGATGALSVTQPSPASAQPASAQPASAQLTWYAQGQQLAQREQWHEVVQHLDQGLRQVEPDLIQLYELHAKALRLDGQPDAAIHCYKKMIVMDPSHGKAYANLGSLYAQRQQWPQAIAAYQQALRCDPDFAGAYRNLARVWQTVGNEAAAAECWFQAYGRSPDWGSASDHFDLGQTLARHDRVDRAIASYHRAIAQDPTMAPAHFQLALLYQQRGDDTNAMLHYGHTLKADTNHGDAAYGLGRLLVTHQYVDRAIACFQKLIQIEPEGLRGPQQLRDLWVEQGRLEEALPYYETLAQRQPQSSTAYHAWGDALVQVERWADAVMPLQQAIQLDPTLSWSHNSLGDALLHLQRWSEAAAAYQEAIALNPDFAWSHYNRGTALSHLEDWDGAIAAYRHAITLDPDLPYGHQKLGDALKQRANADMETALAHYDQAIQQHPTHIDSYHKRLELKNDDPQVYAQLAHTLARQGERTEAMVVCQMGLHLQPSHGELNALLEELTQQVNQHQHQSGASPAPESAIAPASGQDVARTDPSADHQGLLEDDTTDYPWEVYFERGNHYQLQGQLDTAIAAYEKAIALHPHHSWSHHQLGDAYLKLERWSDAVHAYAQAIALNSAYFWSHYNLGVAYTRQGHWHDALRAYRRSIDENPGLNLPCLALNDTLLHQWQSLFDKGDGFLEKGDRDAARAFYRQAIHSYRDRLYLPACHTRPSLPEWPSVLIVADEVLPQCFHYRVQQKLEQLDSAGFPAQYVSKDDSMAVRHSLHFCHIVIFYRVPALPDMIELIQYAKGLGKIVFYEIDDLIFDEVHYPGPFESYGGRVSMDEYYGLIRGATLFREAMALCDYAIASTPALVSAMQPIVAQRQAFLHRNALDHFNTDFAALNLAKLDRDYLSIFYGSGTKAHDTDFNQLAAPALARIFAAHPHVRLTLVGYVSLPTVLEPYGDRIDRIGLIQDIDVYWELLQQADINIAVLYATPETNTKSEIKWLEAAALGIPSVVSATQTYKEILTHGVDGLLCRTPEDWFDSLDQLIKNPDKRHRIATQAKAKAWAEYSIPPMAQNIRHILEQAIADSRTLPSRRSSDTRTGEGGPSQSPQPSSRTKLLIVNVFYPPQSIGGATRIVKDNVAVLTEQYGDQYDLAIFTTDDDYPVPYRLTRYTHKGVPITKVSTPMEEGMDWRYQNSKIYDIFREYLAFERPDLIHFHCVQRLTGSVLEAACDMSIPYVVTVHDAWWISDHQFLVNEDGVECSYQQNDPLVKALEANDVGRSLQRCRYLKQQLNRAQEILAVSEAFAELYRQNGFSKTQANRNGIMPRPRLPRQPNPSGKIRFAHVGGMSAHKGYNLFKDAVEAAHLTHSEVIVVDHSQTVGSVSHSQWGTTPVTFIAKVPQDDMPEFYSKIDVLVAPSMWPESFGLVTREAKAAGVWVIASDKGALAEDLERDRTAHIVSVDTPDELQLALTRIDQAAADPTPNPYQTLIPQTTPIRTTTHQVKELTAIYDSMATL